MGATTEELAAFREDLKKCGVEIVKENLLHERYGAPDRWKRKQAEAFVKKYDDYFEKQNKEASLEQARISNQLKMQSNYIARWALGISVLALIISIAVAI